MPCFNRSLAAVCSACAILIALPADAQTGTRLLRSPTVSGSSIAFAYANDIWIVPRAGGDARRLTSSPGRESAPHFSPDGRWVAFTGEYAGNQDVYVVPAAGGEPRRLTWHPMPDVVTGWSADGARIVFTSGRASAPVPFPRFWSVPVDGGFPEALPIPRGSQGEWSPDGSRFAYRMPHSFDEEWRNYRGGQTRPIWILDMETHDLETPPWEGSEDIDPAWVGDVVYFISDRDFAANIWSFDTRAKQLRQVTTFRDYDVKSLNAGGGAVAFEQGGWVHLLDPATGQHGRVDITVRGDFPWLLHRWAEVGGQVRTAGLSPTGKRAVFEARGDIFTVPAERGDWRNLSATPGVADRAPAWSPDGRWVSWFSDASGEYRLVIAPQDGIGERRTITLPSPTFYFTPAWSPDSRKVLFTDTDLRLWVVDVASGRATHADTDAYMAPERTMNPVWSPDSRWIAYAKRLPSQFHALHVYSLQDGRARQLTDGLSDATSPAWDASGKYLYFLASTNFALNTGWLDMSSYDRPVTRAIYMVVLPRDEPSPLLPRSDEESAGERDDSAAARPGTSAAPRVAIDFDGIMQRIVSLDVPARDYVEVRAGAAGTVFYLEAPATTVGAGGPPRGGTLHRWRLEDREAETFLAGVRDFVVSHDGTSLLYRAGFGPAAHWAIVPADKAAPKEGEGKLATESLRMRVDPKAEFRQMFDEGWRFQRDFLYVENLHGVDYEENKARYAPLLEHVAHRSDLSYLLDVMGGEIAVGHSYVGGGDVPEVEGVPAGLPGADLEVASGRYRIAKIYTGENWNPQLRAPLSAPGIDIRQGEYILAINGQELRAPDNPYRLLEGTADRQTRLRVGPDPSGRNARTITVVPVASEVGLRQFDWVESNRREVDRASGGRLAYVWVPNTGAAGYTFFNRYFFAQQERPGAIIDERFNGGGSAADYMVDYLNRRLIGYFNNPVGERRPFMLPAAGIWGPKVMIVNESAGSGGDLLPYMFRFLDIGPIVGTRTWGGLVGIWDTPPLIDGGIMFAPRGGFFDLGGEWAVENEGVAPDVHVEMTPKDVIAGRDPQLEAAVQLALRLLAENPVVLRDEPPPPVRARRPGG
ncbi:MAG TPA: PDZ domain-containing protein [Longimicrobiales bacterium]|nr:PDZ domain-containing protein [Longimicrobiales bacterium]